MSEWVLEAPYIHAASELPLRDVRRLIDIAEGMESASIVLSAPGRPRSILELEGLGKDVWKGVDAKVYVDELRDEWNAR